MKKSLLLLFVTHSALATNIFDGSNPMPVHHGHHFPGNLPGNFPGGGSGGFGGSIPPAGGGGIGGGTGGTPIPVDPGNRVPDPSAIARANANARANSNAYGGNTNIQGVGNTSFNYPRQTPMAYAPSSYSANPCIMNYSAGGSGAPFGFSLGISAESDECNRRGDAVRWQEMGLPQVACERMIVDSEENQEALKKAGIDCKNFPRAAMAAPADDYVTRPEMNQKLDNYHRLNNEK